MQLGKPEMIFAAALVVMGLAAAAYLGYFSHQGSTQLEQNNSLPLQGQNNLNQQGDTMPAGQVAVIETSKGTIEVELNAAKAPVTVKNFIEYSSAGFYEGTVFHRVIPDFMVQGGGFSPNAVEKDTRAPIKLEAGNGLKNLRGTVAMARTNDPNSATSQFFINLKDNAFLDASPGNDGYAVFGKVVKGMEVVDAIAKVKTATRGYNEDWPVENIVMTKVYIKK